MQKKFETKKSEIQTSKSEEADERFQTMIFEVEDYAIILLNPDGLVTSWNKGAEKIKGYKAEEIVGKTYKLFYPKEDIERGLPEILLEHARTEGKVNHEGWRVRKNGNRFWGSITITALHDANGGITGYIKVTRDLSEKKVIEDRYHTKLEELRLRNEELKREEERYHKMVSEVQDYSIILLDTDGKILDWNKGAERLKGYKANEIVGKNFRLFYPQDDRQSGLPQKLLDRAVKHGYVTHDGYRVRKDGTRFWGNVVITALHDDEGKIIGFSKVTKDLSERKIAEDRLAISTQELKQANEQLRQSEERYHKMIDEVQDYAILLLDSHGEILNWNTGAQLIKGYESKEIIGKSFKRFYLPEDIQRGLPDELLAEAREKGRATNDGWRRRKDGTRFWASVVITALHDSNGNLIGFSKLTRDLTEKKKAEDALKETAIQLELKNLELERLNAELSSFAYVVSHDFKEPIRKIQVFASRQMESDKSIEQVREFSEKIIHSAVRMQRLMESLLSYSRISNDDSAFERVDLNDVLSSVETDLELLISEKEAVIESDRLPVVQGITFQLHQLFLNLISNSIKFSHDDRAARITITADQALMSDLPEELIIKNRNYHRITFADNGIGFDPQFTYKIFDVFKRLKPLDARGTGIGLAIVKKVALNHDGFVIAEGFPGEGAKFHVFLPMGRESQRR